MVKGFGASSIYTKNSSKSSSLLPANDCEQVQKQLFHHFEDLSDPRGKQGVLHPFISIVMIALLATIGGGQARASEDKHRIVWCKRGQALPRTPSWVNVLRRRGVARQSR